MLHRGRHGLRWNRPSIGVGMATAASLNRLSEKLTNGVASALTLRSDAKPVQSTKKSALDGFAFLGRDRSDIAALVQVARA